MVTREATSLPNDTPYVGDNLGEGDINGLQEIHLKWCKGYHNLQLMDNREMKVKISNGRTKFGSHVGYFRF